MANTTAAVSSFDKDFETWEFGSRVLTRVLVGTSEVHEVIVPSVSKAEIGTVDKEDSAEHFIPGFRSVVVQTTSYIGEI